MVNLFKSGKNGKQGRVPEPTVVPELKTAAIAAQYRAARVGGDFYDFLTIGNKLLFVLLDIAGKRETALNVAAAVQEHFRKRGAELYSDPDAEDAWSITTLLLELNKKTIEAAGGVICAPAFLGCYDEDINTLTYINAGHTPGVLKDKDGTLLLSANGLPLGLFSHSTHDSQYAGLDPGAAVVLVSKGLVESKAASQEFGVEKLQKVVEEGKFNSAEDVTKTVFDALEKHEHSSTRFGPSFSIPGFNNSEPNDSTMLVLMRNTADKAARAAK